MLGISNDAVPDFLYIVTAARKSWADKNPDAIVRYMRAFGANFKFIRDPLNRKAVVQTVVDNTDMAADIAQQTLALFFEAERNAMPMRGEINIKGMTQGIAFMGEVGLLKEPLSTAERFIELKYFQMAGVK